MVHASIISSAPLPLSQQFKHWYQWLVLGISGFCLLLPLVYYLQLFVRYKWQKYKSRPTNIYIESNSDLLRRLREVNDKPYFSERPCPLISQPESYALYTGSSLEKSEKLANLDVVAFPVDIDPRAFTHATAALVLAYCDDLGLDTCDTDVAFVNYARRIHFAFSQTSPFRGVLLKLNSNSKPKAWLTFCEYLRSLNIRVLLELHPEYEDLNGINLSLTDGIIIRNGTLLPNGKRRDFFRGKQLRDVLSRCARQKAKRSDFITILHDVCDRPTSAELRRAYKFARFHEVTLSVTKPDTTRISHCLPIQEPYSAFDWLKRLDVLDVHRRWNAALVTEDTNSHNTWQSAIRSLEKILPGIEPAFRCHSITTNPYDKPNILCEPPHWSQSMPQRSSFFTTGDEGQLLSSQACYDLHQQIQEEHVCTIRRTQAHLRELGLLHELTIYERQEVIDRLQPFATSETCRQSLTYKEIQSVNDLTAAIEDGRLRIYRGLDSGFCLENGHFHAWSVMEHMEDHSCLYMSQKAGDWAATILHTVLLAAGTSRARSFEIELLLATTEGLTQGLPPRLVTELKSASYTELLSYLRDISISRDQGCPLLQNISRFSKFLLIEETTRAAWKTIQGRKYQAGEIDTNELYQLRLKNLADGGVHNLPELSLLTRMHDIVNSVVLRALRARDSRTIDCLTQALAQVFPDDHTSVSPASDFLALMIFSAFKQYALDETYIEATDRCPLFHFQKDQPGVFAELWVIGSQCDVYFDMSPRELGSMYYDRYRSYLETCPPPDDAWNGTDVFTAYQKVENPTQEGALPGDPAVKNPFQAKNSTYFPRLQKFAFLSVFCLPAVCDVMLLVFLGRGVLTSFTMTSTEILYGTLGLLTALLLSSGVIGWIGSSGGYYLYNSAFDSMCHVVVHRLSGGLMLTSFIGIISALCIGAQQGWYAGVVFFLYLFVLSIYFNMLGVLATMHRDGSPFPSGRFVLWKSLPILLISPILTTYIHDHDFLIYMLVLYTFITILYINFRRSCTEWSQWHMKIKLIDDQQVLDWYRKDHPPSYNVAAEFEQARAALECAVRSRRGNVANIFQNRSADELVDSLVPGIEYSAWLLTKDSPPGTAPPAPYSSAWNNSLKVALNTYQTFVRGLKEHSAFLQWNYSKNDVAYNCVMFIAALLDRWVAISMSASTGLPTLYGHARYRFAIAFALAYFLTSAVALDYQLQFCWTALASTSTRQMTSLKALDFEESAESNRKRCLYWTSLRDLLVIMLALFGLWSLLMILWVDEPVHIEFFFAYCGAYTFVIWFQFNRVFIKNPTTAWLTIAGGIAVGYITGIVLHCVPATRYFAFIDVMALGLCTCLAGIWSFVFADFGAGRDELEDDIHSPQALMNKTGWKTHSQRICGLSASAKINLDKKLEDLSQNFPGEASLRINYRSIPELSAAIKHTLLNANPHGYLKALFPNWDEMLTDTHDRWIHGLIELIMVDSAIFDDFELSDVAALGRVRGSILEVMMPVPIWTSEWIRANHTSMIKRICEAILHETCESVWGMTHREAVCAELLLSQAIGASSRMEHQISSGTVHQAELVIKQTLVKLMSNLCLRSEPNVQWLYLPQDLRNLIISRIVGEAFYPSTETIIFLQSRYAVKKGRSWQSHIMLCDVAIQVALGLGVVAQKAIDDGVLQADIRNRDLQSNKQPVQTPPGNKLSRRLFYGLGTFFKNIALISNGEPDVVRELVYASHSSSFRGIGRPLLLTIWRICAMARRLLVDVTLIHSRPEISDLLRYCRLGSERKLYKDRVVVRHPFKPMTGFPATILGSPRAKALHIYKGERDIEPNRDEQSARAIYDEQERLIILEAMVKQKVLATCSYDYVRGLQVRVPTRKTVLLADQAQPEYVYYDKHGRVMKGSHVVNDVNWSFKYTYSAARKSTEVLAAHYTSLQNEVFHSVTVYWCIPRSQEQIHDDITSWASTRKVDRAIYVVDDEQWELQFTYHHKRDPTIKCYQTIGSTDPFLVDRVPIWIMQDKNKFLLKPEITHFEDDDLLFHHPPLNSVWQRMKHGFSWASTRTCYSRLDTGTLRSVLWDRWTKSKAIDGVTACYLDDQILRSDVLLRPYWRARDAGLLRRAIRYLDRHSEMITTTIEVNDDVCQNTFLPYKMADLYTMGTGGSANVKTRKFDDNLADNAERLSIMFLDTGCFPDQPGGVSNCRRDLVNGHKSIRNHVFTESANDFGVPRYQIDRNVQSIKVLPLWGLDYLSPYHGLFDNLLHSQVEYRANHTRSSDIRNTFLPIFRCIIRGSRLQEYTQRDLAEFTQAFVDLSLYFEEKDYLKTWKSDIVRRTWRECWLADQPGAISIKSYFGLERPTMAQFDEAMELWMRYFFVFSVRIPEEVPKVFQCTHHGVGSLYGMLLKLRRGTTYMIWDHAIYWRESCLNISSSQCILGLAVQNMLLGVIKLASHLAYTHADVILPCTNQFNPGWEADIGSDLGRRQNKNAFMRKIDPVVNGISEMERFVPVDKIRTENPTVMMLSNVQFIKDVKNAVLSADIIVNRFKFTKYRLVIYGAMDRTPQYTAETEAIIKTRGLENNVKLAGFGNPKEILKDAWAFMNSSLSEGLPLAIGEAALSGAPVIATDVGATGLVISDPKDPKIRYGEIVPPNDSVALARAQIQILAMLGPWAKYCGDDPPPMPEVFTSEDVDWITQRMYDKTAERRALGLKGRETVLHSFNGDRYLREHEQMYWLGAYRNIQRSEAKRNDVCPEATRFDEMEPIKPLIRPQSSKLWSESPWRLFNERDGSIGTLKRKMRRLFKRDRGIHKQMQHKSTELQLLKTEYDDRSSVDQMIDEYYDNDEEEHEYKVEFRDDLQVREVDEESYER